MSISGGTVRSTSTNKPSKAIIILNITGGTMYVSGAKSKSALYIYKCGDLDINITGGTMDGGKGFGISGHTGLLSIADTVQPSGVIIRGGNRAVNGKMKFDAFKVKATASLLADGTSSALQQGQ